MLTKVKANFSSAHVMSAMALFIALGGTAIATVERNQVRSKHVKNNALKSKDLKDDKAVAGVDVVDGSLDSADIASRAVGHAELATNAVSSAKVADGTLGSADVDEASLAATCRSGWVRGYAQVKGSPSMPTTYTTSRAHVDHAFNCTGQAVQVKREGSGYCVRFVGNNAVLAFVSTYEWGYVEWDPDGSPRDAEDEDSDNIVSVQRHVCADNGFFVRVVDVDGFSEHGWFNILIQ